MAEHILIPLFPRSQHHDLNRILTEFIHHIGDQVKTFLVCQSGHNTGNVKDVQDITGLPDYYFTPDKLEAYKDANLLKGGLVFADAITTVSDTYAQEIKTEFYGENLASQAP